MTAHAGDLIHRLSIIRSDVRYYGKRRRWTALLRASARTLFGDIYERCQDCGRRMHVVWHAPDPLWHELVSVAGGGVVCPRCFDAKAEAAGYMLRWTPIVTNYGNVTTSNHWHDPTFDALCMGEPDPDYFPDGKVRVPQPLWVAVREGLVGHPILDGVPVAVYPSENCVDVGGKAAQDA